MQYQKKILSNGLRAIVVPMPSFESATVMVMVGAGSRYETSQNNGISHFLEHMAFKGTTKRPSALDISTLIDGMGGEFNAFTGKETTGYYIKSSKDHVDTSLDVLSDMLQHSLLDPKEIEKEKGVIIEEINLYEDMPMRKIGDIYENLLYGDTPLGWDIAGSKDVIRSITREDFVSYMASLYSSDNMTVIVAGGVDPEAMFGKIDEYFGDMKRFKTITAEPIHEHQDKPAVLLRGKKTEQIHIALGVRTIPVTSEKRYPLSVLAAILGGGMSSRLFHEIREKRGLAYYVRSSAEEYRDAGTLVSMAGIDPKRVVDAVAVMVDEYRKVAVKKLGITDAEMKKAKEFLKGHLVLEIEDSKAVAGYYAHQELLEPEVLNPDEIIEKIENVSMDEVAHVGEEFFQNDGLNLALIGNFDDRQKLTDLLNL